MERTDQAVPAWVNVDFALSDYIDAPFDQVAFRFTAQDTGDGSITEGGVDDFQLYEIDGITPQTDVPHSLGGRTELSLTGSFPNPFRAGRATAMSLTLPAEGRVTARVYDVAGRRVATLLDDLLPAGAHRLEWSGRDDHGRLRAAGIYFVKAESAHGSQSRKLMLIR